jgi:hypothetical protein
MSTSLLNALDFSVTNYDMKDPNYQRMEKTIGILLFEARGKIYGQYNAVSTGSEEYKKLAEGWKKAKVFKGDAEHDKLCEDLRSAGIFSKTDKGFFPTENGKKLIEDLYLERSH